MKNSQTLRSTWVSEIIGSGDDKFGYLVQSNYDTANVKIIDLNSVQLYYHRVYREGP